jgi:hypothetical protein
MYRSLTEKQKRDKDFPQRSWDLSNLRQVLDGTIYDRLNWNFAQEYNEGQYISVFERRPSVRYNLCRRVVKDSIALLFGEGRFPALHCDDEEARLSLAALVKDTNLVGCMTEAALSGSVGSVVVRFRVVEGRPFFDVLPTEYLTPQYDPKAPDKLLRVIERYKLRGREFSEMGYIIPTDDMESKFWFQRIWTADAEEWYLPLKVGATELDGTTPKVPVLDDAETVTHSLGFVPLVWIKNLPGGTGPDGFSTFRPAIDTQIEIEYQLSQAGRGLRYSADPMLVIKDEATDAPVITRSSSNVINVDEKGDAKLLEITGRATEAVVAYVKHLRELALESINGNRSTPDRAAAAQSGRALELLHECLIWLAGELRTPYGAALLALVKMAMRVPDLEIGGVAVSFPQNVDITLRWGPWFHPTSHDKLEEAQALKVNRESGNISRESAVVIVCETYSLPDAPAEMARIQGDLKEADARTIALAAATQTQVKATETLPE